MSDVLQCIKSLVQMIIQSEEYIKYTEAKEFIQGDVELGIRLNEYRMQNFKLQESTTTEEYFEKLDSLEQEYSDLKNDPKIMSFLGAELQLCKMIRQINEAIIKVVDLELKF